MSSHNIVAPPRQERRSRRSPATLTARSGSNSANRAQPRSRTATAGMSRRADIQGLRAVAVLLVVLAHAGVGFLAGGFVGVDVFFVLSGFLITGLLLAEARDHGSVSLIEFYVRRARRILPGGGADAAGDKRRGALSPELRARARGSDRRPPRSRVRRELPVRCARSRLLRPAQTRPRRCSTTGRSRSRSSSISSGRCCSRSRSSASRFVGGERRRSARTAAAGCRRRARRGPRSAGRSISPRRNRRRLTSRRSRVRGSSASGATIAVCATTLGRMPATARLVMGWAGIAGDRRRGRDLLRADAVPGSRRAAADHRHRARDRRRDGRSAAAVRGRADARAAPDARRRRPLVRLLPLALARADRRRRVRGRELSVIVEARPGGRRVRPVVRLVRARRESDPAEDAKPGRDRRRRRRLHDRRAEHRRSVARRDRPRGGAVRGSGRERRRPRRSGAHGDTSALVARFPPLSPPSRPPDAARRSPPA